MDNILNPIACIGLPTNDADRKMLSYLKSKGFMLDGDPAEMEMHWYGSIVADVTNMTARMINRHNTNNADVNHINRGDHMVYDDVLLLVNKWLDYHLVKPSPQPLPPQQTKTQQPERNNMETPDPYSIMIKDITGRVLKEVQENAVNETKVRDIVNGIMEDHGRKVIVIEDRRTSPPEVKDINEACHDKLSTLIGVLNSRNFAYLVGAAGSGKTKGAFQAASVMGITTIGYKKMFRQMSEHHLIGYMDATGKYIKGAWSDAVAEKEKPAMIIIDEIDNGNENVNMLLKDIASGYIAMPYGLQEVNPNLYVVATANTYGNGATREYVGRNAQDAALLNEFHFVTWDYDTEFEWALLQGLFNSYKDTGSYAIKDMRRLLDMFIKMRMKAETQGVRVIISTRNILATARALICNPTWAIHEVLMSQVYKSLKTEDIKRIECPEVWTRSGATEPRRVTSSDISEKVGNNPNFPDCPI